MFKQSKRSNVLNTRRLTGKFPRDLEVILNGIQIRSRQETLRSGISYLFEDVESLAQTVAGESTRIPTKLEISEYNPNVPHRADLYLITVEDGDGVIDKAIVKTFFNNDTQDSGSEDINRRLYLERCRNVEDFCLNISANLGIAPSHLSTISGKRTEASIMRYVQNGDGRWVSVYEDLSAIRALILIIDAKFKTRPQEDLSTCISLAKECTNEEERILFEVAKAEHLFSSHLTEKVALAQSSMTRHSKYKQFGKLLWKQRQEVYYRRKIHEALKAIYTHNQRHITDNGLEELVNLHIPILSLLENHRGQIITRRDSHTFDDGSHRNLGGETRVTLLDYGNTGYERPGLESARRMTDPAISRKSYSARRRLEINTQRKLRHLDSTQTKEFGITFDIAMYVIGLIYVGMQPRTLMNRPNEYSQMTEGAPYPYAGHALDGLIQSINDKLPEKEPKILKRDILIDPSDRKLERVYERVLPLVHEALDKVKTLEQSEDPMYKKIGESAIKLLRFYETSGLFNIPKLQPPV